MTRASDGPVEVVLDQIVEEAPAAIFIKDTAGRYLYVNKQHEVVTGIPPDEVVGKTDLDLYPDALASAYRNDDLQTLQAMSPLRFEEPVIVEGRERLFSIVKFPVLRDEQVIGVCGISVDITEDLAQDPGATDAPQSRADAFFGRLLATLTPQEVRVLDLVVTGLTDREIAEKLSLTGDTVRHHVSHLLKKLRKRRAQVIIQMLKRDPP